MSAGEALMIAASGFLVVFLMLVILWGIIVAVNKVVNALEKPEESAAISFPEEQEETKVLAQEDVPHIYGGEIALYDVDEKTAACIMAIVGHQTKIPLNQLVFKSIRAVE